MKHDMVARREAAIEKLDGYVRTRLADALGCSGEEFTLSVAPEGTRSLVLFLEMPVGRFVVKCLDDIVRATSTVIATRHVVRRGGPVPRLVFADLSPITRMRLGWFVLVEERVEGGSFYEGGRTDARLRAAARALAQLHSVTRPRWGPLLPGLGRRSGYFRDIHARLTRRLDDLVGEMEGFEAIGRPEIREWLGAQVASGEQAGGYSLSHLRVTQTNIMFPSDDEAVLIDLLTARYAHFAIDLERAVQRWCGLETARREIFLETYFGAFTAVTREQWEAVRPYHRASFHLTQAYRAAKELRKFFANGRIEKLRRRRRTLDRSLRRMLRTIAEAPDAPPQEILQDTRRRVLAAARALRARIPDTKGTGSGDPDGTDQE